MADFVPINNLEKHLMAAARDPAARPAFYRALMSEDLFIVPEGPPPTGERRVVLTEATPVKLATVSLGGKPHVPVFTSADRISTVVTKPVKFVAMKGAELFKIVRGSDLVLNPGSGYGKIFTAQEVEAMINGSVGTPGKRIAAAGQKVMLGQPKQYPKHVMDALSRLFAKLREVKAAYLAHAFLPDVDQHPHTVIGLEIDGGEWSRVVADVGVVIQGSARPGEIIDVVQVKAGADDVIGEYMTKSTKAFYTR